MTQPPSTEPPASADAPMVESISERVRRFRHEHPICDMLGENLTHLRFLVV